MSNSWLEQHQEQTEKRLTEAIVNELKPQLKQAGYKSETIEQIIDFYTR